MKNNKVTSIWINHSGALDNVRFIRKIEIGHEYELHTYAIKSLTRSSYKRLQHILDDYEISNIITSLSYGSIGFMIGSKRGPQ